MRYYDSLKNLEPIKLKEDDSLPILEMNDLITIHSKINSLDNISFN